MPKRGRLVYLTGGFLVVTVLALGVTMVYNYDKMKQVEQSLARLTDNVDSQSGYLEDTAQVMLHMDDKIELQTEVITEVQTVETPETTAAKSVKSDTETENSEAEQTVQNDAAAKEEITVQTEPQTESEGSDTEAPVSAVARASYTVKAGDTLAGISEMYYGSLEKVEEICALNGIDDENTILPGQKILLP